MEKKKNNNTRYYNEHNIIWSSLLKWGTGDNRFVIWFEEANKQHE